MCHVVDEIVLHLRDFLLPESHDDGEHEYYQQYERESKCRHHERDRRKYIVLLCGKVHFQIILRAGDIVGEQSLDKHAVAAVVAHCISRRFIKDGTGMVHDRVLKRNMKAECVKLLPQISTHKHRIGTLGDGAVRGS